MRKDVANWIDDCLLDLRRHSSNLAVFVVANIKNVTVVDDDYLGFSVHNDYMTEGVIRGILESLRDLGIYVELFIGEDSFIQAVHAGAVEKVARPHKLVFNLAQSGTGPARKSLVPCFCNLHHLPCCNSDGHVVALLRHKYHATSILRDHGVPVPRMWLFHENGGWLDDARPPEGMKVIVKPTYEAACIGLSRDSVRTSDASLDAFALKRATLMRQPLTVQEFIQGYDIDVPVFLTPNAFAPMAVGVSVGGKRNLGEDFLDFDTLSKRSYDFFDGTEVTDLPAEAMCRAAEKAARVLGIEGYGRIDFRATASGEYFLIDMQTMPDIHEQSSIHFALKSKLVQVQDIYPALMAINCRHLQLFA
jgi:D-alanine-D-alanine ligase